MTGGVTVTEHAEHERGSGFGDRLAEGLQAHGQVCVGIDPHPGIVTAWGLPDTAAGARDFGLRVVEAATGSAGIVKPQVGFFERHGSAGYAALEDVLAAARAAGLLVIADVKRGDIGSSVEAYGTAWLTPGSPLEADAITAVAYQGFGSLAPVVAMARKSAKGVFVLAATSNPEAAAPQKAVVTDGAEKGRTVASLAVRGALAENEDAAVLGDVGVVIGATVRMRDFGIDPTELAHIPILAPGFGHQGARASELSALYGAVSRNVLVSASRSLVAAGPESVRDSIRDLRSEISGVAS